MQKKKTDINHVMLRTIQRVMEKREEKIKHLKKKIRRLKKNQKKDKIEIKFLRQEIKENGNK